MRLPGYDESLQTVKQQGASSERKRDPQKKRKEKKRTKTLIKRFPGGGHCMCRLSSKAQN
jgi:hypothetical protein